MPATPRLRAWLTRWWHHARYGCRNGPDTERPAPSEASGSLGRSDLSLSASRMDEVGCRSPLPVMARHLSRRHLTAREPDCGVLGGNIVKQLSGLHHIIAIPLLNPLFGLKCAGEGQLASPLSASLILTEAPYSLADVPRYASAVLRRCSSRGGLRSQGVPKPRNAGAMAITPRPYRDLIH